MRAVLRTESGALLAAMLVSSQRVRSSRNASSSLPFRPSSRQQGEEEGNRSEIPSPRSNIHQKLAEIKGGDVVICDENILFENKRKIRCLRCDVSS